MKPVVFMARELCIAAGFACFAAVVAFAALTLSAPGWLALLLSLAAAAVPSCVRVRRRLR